MRVDRKRKAQARLEIKLAAIRARRFPRWIRRRPDPTRQAGLEAASGREADAVEERLRSLEIGTPPPIDSGLDLDRPWWAMALTTDPCFLDEDERGDCEMLMGLVPMGSPAPDWHAIQAEAVKSFDRRAKALGLTVDLHLSSALNASKDGAGQRLDLLCEGRALRALPAFGVKNFEEWSGPSVGEGFDRRRAKRRRSRGAPASWERLFGSRAKALWEAGYSPPSDRSPFFDDWAECMACLRDAMLAHGAGRVERCRGFFARRPETLADAEPMELVDRARLDPLRAEWALREAAGGRAAPSRSSSL